MQLHHAASTERLVKLWFVLAFATYPILHIAVSNPGQARITVVSKAVLTALLASVLLLVLLRRASRSWNTAALATSVIVFLFYSYGAAHRLIEPPFLESVAGTPSLTRYLRPFAPYVHTTLSLFWIVLGTVVVSAVVRLREEHVKAAVLASQATAAVLLLLVAVKGVYHWEANATGPVSTDLDSRHTQALAPQDPDIYLIILDGYARRDILKRHYEFDNSLFLDGLEARGFRVFDESVANYAWTFLSLASSLNMTHVQDLFTGKAPSARSRSTMYQAIRDNAVSRFLRRRGYSIVHFESTAGETADNPYADIFVRCHDSLFTDEFFRVVTEASWLKALHPRISADLAECHLANLDRLAHMGELRGPKFVLAHFLPPHHPYLFDQHGRVLRNANLSNQFEFQRRLWGNKTAYLEQLLYMNQRILHAVDRIVAKSPEPPIIVLLSDHGPNLYDVARREHIRARLANLTAILAPGLTDELPPTIHSVNLFRYILSENFDAKLAPLESRLFYSDFWNPYRFEEVRLATTDGTPRGDVPAAQ